MVVEEDANEERVLGFGLVFVVVEDNLVRLVLDRVESFEVAVDEAVDFLALCSDEVVEVRLLEGGTSLDAGACFFVACFFVSDAGRCLIT